MRRSIGGLAFMVAATFALAGCDHGIATGTYKDPMGGSAIVLNGDGSFTMTNLLECKQVMSGTYTVSDHKLRFDLSGGKGGNNPLTNVLQSELAGDISDGNDAFSIMGLSYSKASTDTAETCSSPSTPDAGTAAPAPVAAPSTVAPTPDSTATASSISPFLVMGPKPSGQGNALGLYGQDGTFVPGEYDSNSQFVPGVRRPDGMFIAGRFVGREFVPDTVASGGGFLPSPPRK